MADLHGTACPDDFVNQFDDYVRRQGDDAPKLEESRSVVAQWFAMGVEAGEIEIPRESYLQMGRQLFDRWVLPVRDKRSNRRKKDWQYLLDALDRRTLLGENDPELMHAYKVGDGTDKALGRWNLDDWQDSRNSRYDNAATVTAAAAEYSTDVAQRFIDALRIRGVRTTAELFQ